jgi:Putative adhesin
MTIRNDVGTVLVEHAIGIRGRLAIRLGAAEIRLASTDGDRVIVRTPNGASVPDRVVVETVDGGLTVREKDTLGLSLGLGRKLVQLEVDVPSAAEVAIEIASGWIDGRGLRGEQRYRLVSAETRLRDGAGRIELNTVSGDVTIELADAADLAIKSVSGDVAVRGGRLDGLRIGTTSGDVRVDSPLIARTGNTVETLSGDVAVVAIAGMRVEARTVSGDLTSDLPHRSEGRMGRRTLIVGDGSIELAYRSVSGDLRIHDGSEGHRQAVAPASADPDDPTDAERMTILQALERGELDVPTALDRLAALEPSAAASDLDDSSDARRGFADD